jgi:hypothetical protein
MGILFQEVQPHFDVRQASLFQLQGLFDFDFPHPEHPADFIRREIFIEQPADLIEFKSQIFECDNPVETRKLVRGIVPITGSWIDRYWFQQPQFIVMPEHLDRDSGEAGKITNPEH